MEFSAANELFSLAIRTLRLVLSGELKGSRGSYGSTSVRSQLKWDSECAGVSIRLAS
jgi:hypothetical protein